MSPRHKSYATRKNKQSRKWIIGISILCLIVSAVAVAAITYPQNGKANVSNTDPAFKAFTDHYLAIMKNLNSTEIKTKMAAQLSSSYNQTDLFSWEKNKMSFVQDPAGFFEDPIQILNSGKGICVQWSTVYVAACLSLGYQSRLIVAVDTSSWNFIHVWAEDYYKGAWVHVDPSDGVWDSPARYQSWGWGTFGSQVKVYAFEDGTFQEVTSTYAPHSS